MKKGAFTGANTDRAGVFQAAHQGTLLLDEIGDLPLNMQVKLLRVLQEKTVRRVGSANEEPIDVRVVAASHQSLAHLVAKGQFRQDLFYRLNVMHVTLPPLRERGEDCVALAQAYLLRAQATDTPTLAADAQDWLRAYAFPGNVRELENLMERALALCQAEETSLVRADMLAPSAEQVSTIRESTTRENTTQSRLPTTVPASSELGAASTGDAALPDNNLKLPMDLGAHLASIEKRIIESTLMTLRYNRTATAEALGLNARQLRYRIEQLGIA